MFKIWTSLFKSLTSKEKLCVNLVIGGVLLLTLLPLAVGLIHTPEGFVYTGTGFVGGADKMVYLSQIEEARQGNWLVHNLYTSEPQKAQLFSPVWLAVGTLAKFSGLSNLLAFHLARVILGFVFLWLIYLFLSVIFKEIKWRKIVFVLACFSSGLGFLFVRYLFTTDDNYLYEHLPTDLWVTEGNTFLTLMHSPLFILAQIFILIIFWWALARLSKARWPEVIVMGLFTAFLGIFHPYDLFIVFPVLGVWYLLKCLKLKKFYSKIFSKLAVIGLVASLSLVYFFWLKEVSPAFAGWAIQNITLSPKLLNFIIGYGLIFIFYLFGIRQAVKSKNDFLFFLAIWSLVGWFLVFMPFQFQRRMANGLALPMVIIATVGLINILRSVKNKKFWQSRILRYTVIQLVAVLLFTSNLFMIVAEGVIIFWDRYPVYINTVLNEGLKWLKANAAEGEITLSSPVTGNIIPSFTGRTVYIGHGHQTADWYLKSAFSDLFYQTNYSDNYKAMILQEQGIDYVLWGPHEQSQGNFNPPSKPYLEQVFNLGDVYIFRVK